MEWLEADSELVEEADGFNSGHDHERGVNAQFRPLIVVNKDTLFSFRASDLLACSCLSPICSALPRTATLSFCSYRIPKKAYTIILFFVGNVQGCTSM